MNSIHPPPPRESRGARPDTIRLHTGLLLPFAILVLAQAGCTKSASEPEDILARVGDRSIREADFRRHWDARRPASDAPEQRERLLEQMIGQAALARAARDAGLMDDPSVAEEIDRLLVQRLEETRLKPELDAATIPEAAVRAEYERSRETLYTRPARVRVAVLWYDTRHRQPLVDRYTPRLEEAISIAGTLPVAEGFGPTAPRCSEHLASRYKGGDLGWIDEGPAGSPWHQRVLQIASTLRKPGEVSPVISGDEGLFVVRLLDRQEPTTRTFESVRASLEQRLLAQRRREITDHFRSRLIETCPVERFPDRLLALKALPGREQNLSHSPAPVRSDAF